MGNTNTQGKIAIFIVTTPVILGDPFIAKHKISICSGRSYIYFLDQILQINKIISEKQPRRMVKQKKIAVYTQKRKLLQTNQQAHLECNLLEELESTTDLCGIISSNKIFEKIVK